MKINKIKNRILLCAGIALLSACSKDGGGNMNDSLSGQGGSMARFTIKDNILYVVDNQTLKMFDVKTAAHPLHLTPRDQRLDAGAETIFVMDTLLFIGSENGLYIYDVREPDRPQRFSFISHIRSCDPVVAYKNYAYVTLNSKSARCGRGVNELQVYDISNPSDPLLQKTEAMNSPQGLGVDGKRNKLFVCDNNGVKIYDISDPVSPKWIDDFAYIPEAHNIDAYDVIPQDGILLMIGKDGFFQFDYTGDDIKFLSKIMVEQ